MGLGVGMKKKYQDNDVVFVVGDIHGMAHMLEELQARIAERATALEAKHPKIVYTGDYIDRGPNSKRVIELVMSGIKGFDSVPLMGNHEDMLIDFLDNPDETTAQRWLFNGGIATCKSYGVDVTSNDQEWRPKDIRHAISKAMPAEHLDFIRNGLSVFHDDKFAIYVHAGLIPGIALEDQARDDMLWVRQKFLGSDFDWGRPVVHGHTPSRSGPELRPNRINVDTGAVYKGDLTAAILDGGGIDFIMCSEFVREPGSFRP